MKRVSHSVSLKSQLLAVLFMLQVAGNSCSAKKEPDSEAIMPEPPIVTAEIKREPTQYIELRASKATWKKISLLANTKGVGYLGPLLIPLGILVLAADVVSGSVTIPYDIIASPFRERQYRPVAYWKVVGRVTDKVGKGIAGFPLRVNIGILPPEGNSVSLGGQTFVNTGDDGKFSALISGEAPVSREDRMDLSIYVGHSYSYTRTLARIGTNAISPTAPENYRWSEYGAPGDKTVFLKKFEKFRSILEKTQDSREFVEYAKKVDSRYPPECLDVIIDRFDEFYYIDTKHLGTRSFRNPKDIFSEQGQVIRYLTVRDGKRFKTAIQILKGMFLLDHDREAILTIFAAKYDSVPSDIKKEMLELVGIITKEHKSKVMSFLETLNKLGKDTGLLAAVQTSTNQPDQHTPQPTAEAPRWKLLKGTGDKSEECVSLPYGTRHFSSTDYSGIIEFKITGSTGVVLNKKFTPPIPSLVESVPGLKPGKYTYVISNAPGGRTENCFEVIGLNAIPEIQNLRSLNASIEFDLNFKVSAPNGLKRADLFDTRDMSNRQFPTGGPNTLKMSLNTEQLPAEYLLQITDNAGYTVQKDISFQLDENGKLTLKESENHFNVVVRKGKEVEAFFGPWLKIKFFNVSSAGNINIEFSQREREWYGRIMALPRIIALSPGLTLAFEKAEMTFNVDAKDLSRQQREGLLIHQVNSNDEKPTVSNALNAELNIEKNQLVFTTDKFGRYVVSAPAYKKLYRATSKKMAGQKAEAEILSGIDVQLIEAPAITADRAQDIPEGVNIISQVYGFKAKSGGLSANTDIILRYDPKTDPCTGRSKSNPQMIFFGKPSYSRSHPDVGNDKLGERYGELINIGEADYLIALACMGDGQPQRNNEE